MMVMMSQCGLHGGWRVFARTNTVGQQDDRSGDDAAAMAQAQVSKVMPASQSVSKLTDQPLLNGNK